MNQVVKKKWLEALRSGNYRQTQQYLYDDGAYCCLGVLVDIYLSQNHCLNDLPGIQYSELIAVNSLDQSGTEPSFEVSEWAGLDTNEFLRLVQLNDDELKDFHQIAEHIENNL